MEQPIEILYEDDSVLCCVKPAGLLSQSAPGGAPDLVQLLQRQTGGEIYPVHRLDRAVGGVMLFAKTDAAAAALNRQIAERTLEKRYVARIHGVMEPPQGVLEDLLFKDTRTNKVFVVTRPRKGVRAARLFYETEQSDGETSRVAVLLDTGRTHQIRVQFASRKHPLLGDRRYGARDGEAGLCLWSRSVTFRRPDTGEKMTVSAGEPF
ncbi:MAG: RluA family pseudouridine synthase [Clostridia bacterium]|nr:RluA family pseudouridine synthase [Clostridia bacterium]